MTITPSPYDDQTVIVHLDKDKLIEMLSGKITSPVQALQSRPPSKQDDSHHGRRSIGGSNGHGRSPQRPPTGRYSSRSSGEHKNNAMSRKSSEGHLEKDALAAKMKELKF